MTVGTIMTQRGRHDTNQTGLSVRLVLRRAPNKQPARFGSVRAASMRRGAAARSDGGPRCGSVRLGAIHQYCFTDGELATTGKQAGRQATAGRAWAQRARHRRHTGKPILVLRFTLSVTPRNATPRLPRAWPALGASPSPRRVESYPATPRHAMPCPSRCPPPRKL